MSTRKAQFAVGDKVREKVPKEKEKVGTVLSVYELTGEYRYVVEFEDGQETVLFENELLGVRA